MRILVDPVLLSCLALCAPCSSQQVAPAPIPPPLGDRIEALRNQSSWAQDVRAGDGARRGAYPVGNGRVFASIGLGHRANTMQAITGPRYGIAGGPAGDGPFGEITFELRAGGRTLELPAQRVRRVRGASFVVTEDASDRLVLRTLTFAEPDTLTIRRVVEVENVGAEVASGLELAVDLSGLAVELGRRGVRVNCVGPTYVLTPAIQARIDAGKRDPEVLRDSSALKVLIYPEDVADVIAFLCSNQARAITGVHLPVDAGWAAATPYQAFAGGMPWEQ